MDSMRYELILPANFAPKYNISPLYRRFNPKTRLYTIKKMNFRNESRTLQRK